MDKEFKQITGKINNWFAKHKIVSASDKIRLSQPVFDTREVEEVLRILLLSDGWIAQGPEVGKFEKEFAEYIHVKEAVAVNSGSSANLVAMASMIQNGLLNPGDEVIIPAATFPTVAAPVIQMGLKPVFVDVGIDGNIDPTGVREAVNQRTKMVMVVHTLGKPADIPAIKKATAGRNIFVFEDCCEAHGAAIGGRKVGSFGIVGTFSFYVAHNMTTGEGGMVVTDNHELAQTMRSLREFGRYKGKGSSDRFSVKDPVLGNYDTRQLFSLLGYNLKMSDIEAAMGRVQLRKLERMNNHRRKIAEFYSSELERFGKYFTLPKMSVKHRDVFYGYLLIIKPNAGFDRGELVNFLEKKGIETRPLFGGCLPDQPAFRNIDSNPAENLVTSRLIRDNALFVGCHPGISLKDARMFTEAVTEFVRSRDK